MPNYSFLKNILVEIEQFKSEKERYPQNVKEFAYWLYYDRLTEDDRSKEIDQRISAYGKDFGGKIQNTVSNLFTAMHRFKMYYFKMVLHDSVFETYDEFSFLLSLVFHGPYSHSQLIEKHLQNKATGTEIIRRLIRKELIEQMPSADDKRSKLLKVTPTGKKQFLQIMDKVSAISDLLLFPLSQNETLDLMELLQKLDDFHRDIFEHEKKFSMDQILDKHQKENGRKKIKHTTTPS